MLAGFPVFLIFCTHVTRFTGFPTKVLFMVWFDGQAERGNRHKIPENRQTLWRKDRDSEKRKILSRLSERIRRGILCLQ
jgi:hypothetical protein